MEESPIITMLKTMMSTLSAEEQQQLESAVGEKLKNLQEDIGKAMDPDSKRVVDYLYQNRQLGADLYEIAEMQFLGNPVSFDELPVPNKMYWTKLALSINFDPENLRCVCPECLAEEQSEDPEVEDEEHEPVMSGSANELPEAIKAILREKGVDLDNAQVKVFKLD